MAYDFAGPWSPVTGFDTPLYGPAKNPSADKETARSSAGIQPYAPYLNAGVPAKKLVLGVPFYGGPYAGVKDLNHGLFSAVRSEEARVDRRAGGVVVPGPVLESISMPPLCGELLFDETAKVPWLYDPKARLMISAL